MFEAALRTVDRVGGEQFEVVFSQGSADGATTVRDFRHLCDESPYESGRKRRPGYEDGRVIASMYVETKTGTPEGGKAEDRTDDVSFGMGK